MRVPTQTELSRMSRPEMMALLQRISAQLPDLADGSPELRAAQFNLRNIRRASLGRPGRGCGFERRGLPAGTFSGAESVAVRCRPCLLQRNGGDKGSWQRSN